jgi:hypothetical protein
MKALNPRCFGVWGAIGKRVKVEKPNRVSAKCVISKSFMAAAKGGPEKKGRKYICSALKQK